MSFYKSKKKKFMTWDTMCLQKLKEIGRSTQQQWAEALGYRHASNLNKVIKNNKNKLIITMPKTRKNRRFYEVKRE